MILHPGDVLKPAGEMHPDVRFRVREIETVWETSPFMEKNRKVSQYVLQLYSAVSPKKWGWLDRSHDYRFTADMMADWEVTERSQIQLELFAAA